MFQLTVFCEEVREHTAHLQLMQILHVYVDAAGSATAFEPKSGGVHAGAFNN